MNKVIIKKAIIINAAIFVSLLLCEGILRFIPAVNNSRIASKKFRSQVAWLDEYTRVFKKNICHEFEEAYRPEGEKYFSRSQPRLFRTDENGYIIGSSTDVSDFVEFRILFSGGSTVECQEVDEPLRFPFAVQSILNEKGLSEIHALNLGIRGHTTFETIKLMIGTNLFDNFQAILFMHNINDWTVLANCSSYFPSSPDGVAGRYGSTNSLINKIIENAHESLTTKSSLVFLLNNLYHKYFSSEIIPQPEEPVTLDSKVVDNICRTYHKNTINLAVLTKAKNAEPVFLTEPSPFEGGLQEELNNELRKICQSHNYHLIDVARRFPINSEHLFFPDMVHLNNEGSLLVAQIVADELPYLLESKLSELPIKEKWLNQFFDMLTTCSTDSISVPYNARYPVMSKDMDKFYFQAIFNGNNQICCIDLKKGLLTRLSPFAHSFWHPCPHNDGVYAVSNCLKGEKIFSLTGQNMKLLPVFNAEEFEGAIPACAPSGLICFPGFYENKAPDLFTFSPQDNILKQITTTSCEEWRPVFHPDKHRIFYICNQRGNFDIFSYDIDKNTSDFVIGTDGDDWDVDISHDGNLIVFAAKKDGNFDLMLYDLVKNEIHHITYDTGNEWDPRFSPNGKIIMYAEEKDQKSSIKFIKVPL